MIDGNYTLTQCYWLGICNLVPKGANIRALGVLSSYLRRYISVLQSIPTSEVDRCLSALYVKI